jgi:hypothetical protein
MNLILPTSSHLYLVWVFFALVLLPLTGCRDDDDPVFGDITGSALCRNAKAGGCTGEAVCVDGRCECLDQSNQLAPGFCVQNDFPNTFVTVDTTLGCIDTTLVSFMDDPFDLFWPNGVQHQQLRSYVYNRDPNSTLPGGLAITVLRPDDTDIGVDSVYITRILGTDGDNRCSIANWRCQNSFFGAFVGRDTIRGVLQFIGCDDRNSGESIPEAFTKTYPMTFVRVN